jgi:hemerythrin-like domain-containing protein
MNPTGILSDEHRIIAQVLNCLEAIVRKAGSVGRLDRASADDAVAFFRSFADRCHHGKEETYLFPALEAKGFPRTGGPTGVMLYEQKSTVLKTTQNTVKTRVKWYSGPIQLV